MELKIGDIVEVIKNPSGALDNEGNMFEFGDLGVVEEIESIYSFRISKNESSWVSCMDVKIIKEVEQNLDFKIGDKVKLKDGIVEGQLVGGLGINRFIINDLMEYGTIVELDAIDGVHGVMEKGGDLRWGMPWYIHEDALEILQE